MNLTPPKSVSATYCTKCNGTGTLPHYFSVDGGKCYGCGGTGIRRKVGAILRVARGTLKQQKTT